MKFDDSTKLGRVVVYSMLAMFLGVPAQMPARAQDPPSQAPDMRQMQKKIEQLEKELEEVKNQMKAATASLQQAVPGPSVPVATETRDAEERGEQTEPASTVDFYGFVMLDSGYDLGTNDPNWFDVMRPTKLPSVAGEFAPSGKTYWGVRQTRFGVKTFTPTELGNLKTIFEFELFGSSMAHGTAGLVWVFREATTGRAPG